MMNIKYRLIGFACSLSMALSAQASSIDVNSQLPLLKANSFEPCTFRITDLGAALVNNIQGCVVGPYNRVFYVKGHIPSFSYSWSLGYYDKNILIDMKKYYTADNPDRMGGGGTWTWEFTACEEAANSPNVTIELEYVLRSSFGNPDSEMRFIVPVSVGKYGARLDN